MTAMHSYAFRTDLRVCMPARVHVSSRPPSRKRRYDTIFGQCDSPHDVRFSRRRWIPCRECRISVIVTGVASSPENLEIRIVRCCGFVTVSNSNKAALGYIDTRPRREKDTQIRFKLLHTKLCSENVARSLM